MEEVDELHREVVPFLREANRKLLEENKKLEADIATQRQANAAPDRALGLEPGISSIYTRLLALAKQLHIDNELSLFREANRISSEPTSARASWQQSGKKSMLSKMQQLQEDSQLVMRTG